MVVLGIRETGTRAKGNSGQESLKGGARSGGTTNQRNRWSSHRLVNRWGVELSVLSRRSGSRGGSNVPMIKPPRWPFAQEPAVANPQGISMTIDSEKVLGNIFFLGSGETVARMIAFIGTSYLARILEPAGFGIIGFATAICAYLALTVASTDDLGSREVALRPQAAGTIAVNVVLVRLGVALLAFCAIGIVAWLLDKPLTVKLVITLTGLSFFSLALDTSWAHKGLEQNRLVSLALILGQTLYVGTLLLAVRGSTDIARVPLAQFLGDASAGLFLVLFFVRFHEIKFDLREGFNVLRGSGYRFISKLLRTITLVFGWVALGFLLGERPVGLYTAAYRFCFLLLVIATAIHASYLPLLARLSGRGGKAIAALAGRSMELASAIGMPIIIGGIIVAGPLLRTLFGAQYTEGTDAFRFLILSMGFVFISGAIRNILLVTDRLKIEMWIVAIAAAVNIVLNILVIPRYGLVGTAFVTALTEALILFIGLPIIYRIGIRPDLRRLFRPLLAASVMGGGLVLLGWGRILALSLLVGPVIYLLALAVLCGIPEEASPHVQRLVAMYRRKCGLPQRSEERRGGEQHS